MQAAVPDAGEVPDALVFFGATGDLARHRIFPALHALVRNGLLTVPIIGVARGDYTRERLRALAAASIEQHGDASASAPRTLTDRLDFVGGDYQDADTYVRLRAALSGARRPLHYLAIPPAMFAPVIRGLAAAGCIEGARVVVEKPFGRDLASARALNRILHEVLPESRIFRIDHYLGKEAVQNLLYFRFANGFVEPLWNRAHVSSVQITMAEEIGVSGRGAFYDEVGTLRDVVQNHLLQVVALLAMDAPAGRGSDALRAAQMRLFGSISPLQPGDVVRGQYRGYRAEAGVRADSQTETFVALRLRIDNPRWAGVPFYLRAGKRMPLSATEVIVELRPPAAKVFDAPDGADPNRFRFRLSPEVIIALAARVKRRGQSAVGEDIELVAHRAPAEDSAPYVRLLGDALHGDTTLFTRDDVVERAWEIMEPALLHPSPLSEYAPGAWGPEGARALPTPPAIWLDPHPEPPPC